MFEPESGYDKIEMSMQDTIWKWSFSILGKKGIKGLQRQTLYYNVEHYNVLYNVVHYNVELHQNIQTCPNIFFNS